MMERKTDKDGKAVTSTAKVADRISFSNFVTLLERISASSDGKEKLRKLTLYFEFLRSAYKNLYGTLDASLAHNDSLFPIVRIFLPLEDKQRLAFGMKSPTLAKIFAKILCLDEKSEDGKKLIHFKDPEKSGLEAGAGNLPNVILSVLAKRLSSRAADSKASKGPTIADLHVMLDKIVKTGENSIDIDGQCKILRGFILKLSPLEGKWLAKILLKKLSVGLSTQQIYRCIHPRAQEYFGRTRNLEAVCIKLNDPTEKLTEADEGIQLFHPFKPMLCDRISVASEAKGQEAFPKLKLPTPPFILELKFDGERFTVHYDASKTTEEGGQFRYFSRAGNDWARVFNLSLTPRLKPLISESCQSFILDGEMMAWDFISTSFTQKGANVNLVTMKPDDSRHCPVFIVFDLLYLNGEDLTSKTLKERMTLLRSEKEVWVTEKQGVIQFNKQTLAESEEQVLDALDEAVSNLEEGLIVKELSSKYLVGKRVSTWVKVKPEYFADHNVTDLDLVIVGCYYTKSYVRGGVVNHFLAALVDKSHGKGNEEFYPLSRLGPGCLKVPEVQQLVQELKPNFIRQENPSFKVHMKGIKRPDFYIDPKKSLVVQVKAAEILNNESVALKCNLRFPQIVSVRRDKSWEEAVTVEEFHKVRTSYGGKLSCGRDRGLPHTAASTSVGQNRDRQGHGKYTNLDLDLDLPPQAKPMPKMTPKKARLGVNSPLKYTGSTAEEEVKVIQNIFNSRLFMVIGSLDWKPKVETLIRQYGGSIVQNPTKNQSVFAIIAEIMSMKAKTFVRQGIYDILKLSWLEKCISEKAVVKILPEYLWSAGPETKKILSKDYDPYGDSYTEQLTSIETKRLINDIVEKMDLETETGNRTNNESPLKLMRLADLSDDDLEEEDWIKLRKYNFLVGCKIAFRPPIHGPGTCEKENSQISTIISKYSTQIQFYGGEVAQDERDEGVTHVVVFDLKTPSKKKHLSAYVVKDMWLTDCLEKKKVLEELYYMVE